MHFAFILTVIYRDIGLLLFDQVSPTVIINDSKWSMQAAVIVHLDGATSSICHPTTFSCLSQRVYYENRAGGQN